MSQLNPGLTPSHIAVIVAAGKGLRFLSSQPNGTQKRPLRIKKQFVLLSGEAVLDRTLRVFIQAQCFREIILVLSRDDFEIGENIINRICAETRTTIPVQIVSGGSTRFESVYNGLSFIQDELSEDGLSDDFCVAVHDGVRPLITTDLIQKSIQIASEHKSALPVLSIKETIKRIDKDGHIVETIPRDNLVRSQTPQTFHFASLWSAFQLASQDNNCPSETLTDEAKVFELYSKEHLPVQTFEGEEENLKITTYDDLKMASAILLRRQDQ